MPYIDELETPNGTVYDVKDTKSGYATKVASATNGNLANLNASGEIGDSGYKPSDLIQSNPNLLDNPFFTVNERGQSSYSTLGYTLNRYRTWTNDVTVTPLSPNGVTIANSGTGNYVLTQYITNELANLLRGKTVTLSIMLTDGTIISNTDVLANSGAYELKAETTDVKIRLHLGSTATHYVDIYINGTKSIDRIKLELGSTCTIALDAPRPYAEELARCQTNTADTTYDAYVGKGNYVLSNSIAPTEDGATASKPYVVGEPFFRGGDYCVCIQPIASGGSFTLNTNYKVEPLSDYLTRKEVAITVNTTNVTAGTIKAYRYGKVVEVILNKVKFSTTTGNQIVATGLPSAEWASGALIVNDAFCGNIYVVGNRILGFPTVANAELYGSFIYIAND